MKELIVYDTRCGNREKIANAIGRTVGADEQQAIKVNPSCHSFLGKESRKM